MTGPAEQPASPRRERSLTGFYIAVGVAAALFALGTWLYRPLRLRYAIYRVENAPPAPPLPSSALKLEFADKWLLEVLDAARRGDRRAIGGILDHADFRAARRTRGTSVRFVPVICFVAEAQPERFSELLERRQDKREILDIVGCERTQELLDLLEVGGPGPADEPFKTGAP